MDTTTVEGWERLAKQAMFDEIVDDAFSPGKPSKKMLYRYVTKEEVAEVKRQNGPDISGLFHEITAEEIRHAMKRHSGIDDIEKNKNLRPLRKH
jgi:hypothetical protein